MSIFSILDRKWWSALLDIDGKLDGIDERISLTNGKIKELSNEVKDNTKRIITLESDFKNCKENASLKIENTILKILQSGKSGDYPKQLRG